MLLNAEPDHAASVAPVDPDAEVVPGVHWGRPEWVPSAAFWSFMVSRAREDVDGFVDRNLPLAEEIGSCLIGGFGITAEMNHAVHARLLGEDIYKRRRSPSAEKIEVLLREPVLLGGRHV